MLIAPTVGAILALLVWLVRDAWRSGEWFIVEALAGGCVWLAIGYWLAEEP